MPLANPGLVDYMTYIHEHPRFPEAYWPSTFQHTFLGQESIFFFFRLLMKILRHNSTKI